MDTTWILAADSSRAKVLEVVGQRQHYAEIETLANPDGRAHDRDLISDRHPQMRGGAGNGNAPGSDRQETSATEHAAERFAKRIADKLEAARIANRYDRLHLVAPPKFLGLLRRELSKEVQKRVLAETPKDVAWMDRQALEAQLSELRNGG